MESNETIVLYIYMYSILKILYLSRIFLFQGLLMCQMVLKLNTMFWQCDFFHCLIIKSLGNQLDYKKLQCPITAIGIG